MGTYDEVNVHISGQVKPMGLGNFVMAKLRLLCAEYGLDMEVLYNEPTDPR